MGPPPEAPDDQPSPPAASDDDPTFWSRQLEVLYSVLLSASLGVIMGTSLPTTANWSELRSATTLWAWLVFAVAVISVDAWYNFNQIIRGARFGESQGFQTAALAASIIVFTFLPFQFITRHVLSEHWFRALTPITAFALNLFVITALQAGIAFIGSVKLGQGDTTGRRVDIQISPSARRLFSGGQLQFLAGSRLLFTVVLLIAYLFASSSTNDNMKAAPIWPAIAIFGGWLTWRALEHTIGLYWLLPKYRDWAGKNAEETPSEDTQ